MKFSVWHIVVLNDGTPFKEAFVVMCQELNLNYDVLAKRNHKGLTVEFFYRFLNKSVTIATDKCVANYIFVPADVVAGYT